MRLLALSCLVLVCCGDGSPSGPTHAFPDATTSNEDAGTPGVSFRADVAPIFATKCIACHYRGALTQLDLTRPFDPAAGIVNHANTFAEARHSILVVPGKPEESFLIDKVEGTGLDPNTEGLSMPYAPERLTADEVASITQWITDGAKNDATFKQKVAPIFGDGVHLGRRAGKCSYCHSPSSVYKPDLVDPFDTTKGIVGVTASAGGKLVVPGDPEASVLLHKVRDMPLAKALGAPMPKQFARLTAQELETVKTWIREGARNN